MSTQLPPSRLSRPSATLRSLGVLGLATTLCACEAVDTRGAGTALQPTQTASITASIQQESAVRPAHGGAAFCGFSSWLTPTLGVVVVALAPVHIHSLTMQMVDGSVVGGPMIPFPSALPPFGPMFMPTGATRVFTFHSSFACVAAVPRSVRATITFVNRAGLTQVVTVDAPFR